MMYINLAKQKSVGLFLGNRLGQLFLQQQQRCKSKLFKDGNQRVLGKALMIKF